MPTHLRKPDGSVSVPRLFAVCAPLVLLSEIATFEILMVNPALPEMARQFDTLHIAWVSAIVTLAGAVTLPLVGRIADRHGKKTVVAALSAVFVAGSLVCALTDSFALMLLGRALQGPLVGIVSISYSLVRDIVPRSHVPVVLGTVVTGVGMGAVAGPFLAGWIIGGAGARGIFWFLAAYVAVLLGVFLAVVPESPVRVVTPLDWIGALLLGPALGLALLGLGGLAGGGVSAGTLGMLCAAAVLLAAFAVWERRTASPLIDPKVLTGPRFGLTVVAVGLVSYMMNAHALISPLVFRAEPVPGNTYGAGLTAMELAVWTCPLGLTGMLAGPLGGHLSKRYGAQRVLTASAVLFLAVMFLGSRLFTVQWQVGLMSVATGFAMGFLHSSNANLLQDALPLNLSGVGNSIAGVVALVAAAAGTSVTGAVMSGHTRKGGDGTVYADSAFTTAYLYAAVIGAVGLLVVLVMKHGRRPARGGLETGAEPEPEPGPAAPAPGPPPDARPA